MKLFYPAQTETALNILRAGFRYDLIGYSPTITLFKKQGSAEAAAIAQRGQSDQEMALVVIDIDDSALEDVGIDMSNRQSLVANSKAQDKLSQYGNLSLVLVSGTANQMATYGARAPECGAGAGPWH